MVNYSLSGGLAKPDRSRRARPSTRFARSGNNMVRQAHQLKKGSQGLRFFLNFDCLYIDIILHR